MSTDVLKNSDEYQETRDRTVLKWIADSPSDLLVEVNRIELAKALKLPLNEVTESMRRLESRGAIWVQTPIPDGDSSVHVLVTKSGYAYLNKIPGRSKFVLYATAFLFATIVGAVAGALTIAAISQPVSCHCGWQGTRNPPTSADTADVDDASRHLAFGASAPSTTWDAAKSVVYDVDEEDGQLQCVYSGTTVPLEDTPRGRKPKSSGHVDVEHTWPKRAPWGAIEGTAAEFDAHQLFPTRAGLNRSRGNLPFGVPTVAVVELRVDPTSGYLAIGTDGVRSGSARGKNGDGALVFMPRETHRGNAARAVFYVSLTYGQEIPDGMETILRQWHKADPVDPAERSRNQRVRVKQGNTNPFIDHPELVDGIDDF